MKNKDAINESLENTISSHLNTNIKNANLTKLNEELEFVGLTSKASKLEFLKIANLSRELTDFDCGIVTTKIAKENSQIPVVGSDKSAGITIRDGRFKNQFVDKYNKSLTKSHPSESKYTWIGQMAITAQGVEDLIALSTEANDSNAISDAFKASLEQMDKTDDPKKYKKIALGFNKKLEDYVKSEKLEFKDGDKVEKLNSSKKIVKAIDVARHFAQLKLEHNHNITISKDKNNNNIIQTNLIVNSNINNYKYEEYSQKLDPLAKKLFEQNRLDIISGEKVISSRLKNLVGIPASTNAYMAFNHMDSDQLDKSNGRKIEQIGTPNFRTSALANTKGKDAYKDTAKVVKDMADLNKKVNPKSNGLVVLNLNNTTFFDRKEKKIRENTEKACKENGVEYKNVPINVSSAWSYLFGESKKKKFEKIINTVLEAEKDGKTLLIQCKSGKDRTGYAQILKNCLDYQKKQEPDSDKTYHLEQIINNKLFKDYTKDNVQEYQSGGVGGSLGVNALKSGGFIATGGKKFLNEIGGGNILQTNELDKLNKFKGKDYPKEAEEKTKDNSYDKSSALLGSRESLLQSKKLGLSWKMRKTNELIDTIKKEADKEIKNAIKARKEGKKIVDKAKKDAYERRKKMDAAKKKAGKLAFDASIEPRGKEQFYASYSKKSNSSSQGQNH